MNNIIVPYKKKLLTDFEHMSDDIKKRTHFISRPRGHVIFKDPITGETLFEKNNKVVISGSQYTACCHFPIEPWVALPTYNTSLSLDNNSATIDQPTMPFDLIPPDPITGKKQKKNIWLFCCGTDGCGSENSQVYDVDYKGRISPEAMIPFKYCQCNDDLDEQERNLYFGRRVCGDNRNMVAYYFKAFESDPTPYMRYVSVTKGEASTNIDATLYDSKSSLDAECFIELSLQITKEDFRQYFIATESISAARINSISLCSAWRQLTDDLNTDYNTNIDHPVAAATNMLTYQDITPVTQLNIHNESLVDTTKGIDITYQIFY